MNLTECKEKYGFNIEEETQNQFIFTVGKKPRRRRCVINTKGVDSKELQGLKDSMVMKFLTGAK